MAPEDKRAMEAMSPTEVHLARLAAQHGHQDGYLLDLIQLADANLGLAVGLLLNGMIVIGSLAPSEEMAQEVDAERSRLAKRFGPQHKPEDLTQDEWAKRLKEFGSTASDNLRRFREEEEALEVEVAQFSQDGRLDLEALPAKTARKLIDFEARNFLTLKNVQIVAPAQAGTMKIEVLRIAVGQIDAWWPLRLDEEGRASFKMFSTESTQEA